MFDSLKMKYILNAKLFITLSFITLTFYVLHPMTHVLHPKSNILCPTVTFTLASTFMDKYNIWFRTAQAWQLFDKLIARHTKSLPNYPNLLNTKVQKFEFESWNCLKITRSFAEVLVNSRAGKSAKEIFLPFANIGTATCVYLMKIILSNSHPRPNLGVDFSFAW